MRDKPMLGDEELDAAVLDRLCKAGPWTDEELVRELGIGGRDAADRLVSKGMAHRIGGGFVFSSASGRYAHDLDPTWR
jgi:hypothetical protein